MTRPTIRVLIFDFDGLILDTEVPVYESWKEIYRAYGLDLPLSVWAMCIGSEYGEAFDPFVYLEEQLGASVDRKAIDWRRHRRELELVGTQTVLPGVEGYIADAKRLGLKLGIASSSDRGWVIGNLRRLGLLEHFDTIKTADDVGQVKPDPELYLAALDELGVEAHESIVLEDSPNGVLAAKRAGILCVAVPNLLTRQLDLSQADLLLDSLADLSLEELLVEIGRDERGTP